MTFKLTYATMFDPPPQLHARFEEAVQRARARLGGKQALHIGGEDRAVQAEDRVVGDIDRLFLAVGGDDADDRAENLLLGDHHTVIDIGEHSRLDEKAAIEMGGPLAAGGEGRALGLALRDIVFNPLPLPLHGQGSHLIGRIEGIADPQRLGGFDERPFERVGDLPYQDETFCGQANLACIVEP